MEQSPKEKAEKECVRIANNIGILYKKQREKLGISLRELSKQINLSVGTLSELEKGNNIPRVETLLYIGFSLGISTSDIINVLNPSKLPLINEPFNPAEKINDVLKACLYELNEEGTNVIMDFIEYIKSKNKYLSKSAYKKRYPKFLA